MRLGVAFFQVKRALNKQPISIAIAMQPEVEEEVTSPPGGWGEGGRKTDVCALARGGKRAV